eukprot:7940723-Alexandrium_andersonii.AAC.1
MSASLVGSEMCIRDRFGGSATLTRRFAIQAWGSCTRVRTRRGPRGCRRCLLYTSDAADDM